jgi:gliding motility-associated-like protein
VHISGNGSISISSTAGQTEYETHSSNELVITQGFEQPNLDPLQVEYQVELPLCAQENAEIIISISGCSNVDLPIVVNGLSESDVIGNLDPGIYNIQVGNPGTGCFSEEEILIDYGWLPDCELTIYSVLSPDLDGFNDYWHIENIDLDKYRENSVRIFNRWGQQVWQGVNYDNDLVVWQGNGELNDPLPSGTYYYLLQIEGSDWNGFIELIR